MFSRIFIEKEYQSHPVVQNILKRFPNSPVKKIDDISSIFGQVKRPYLQKREDLQLFLGAKKGTLIKEAPDAYGLAGDPHYYFIHAYNCIYECEYCYLQGHFQSPDIVLFLNHEEICHEIQILNDQTPKGQKTWFHAGEFSDSLALSHLTGELPYYFNFFKTLENSILELRTKSSNIKEILKLEAQSNIITSFSISPSERIKRTDLKTPGLKARIQSMKELQENCHPIALHFDPVIYEVNFEKKYEQLFKELNEKIDLSKIHYLSLGVVRFTPHIFHQMKKNYPDSDLLNADFGKGLDGKVRYPKPMRYWMLGKIKSIAISYDIDESKIYLCME